MPKSMADVFICDLCEEVLHGATALATHKKRKHLHEGKQVPTTSTPGKASGSSTSLPPTFPLLLSPIHQLHTQKRSIPPGTPGAPGPPAAKRQRQQPVVVPDNEFQVGSVVPGPMFDDEEENGIIEISNREQAGELIKLLDEFKLNISRNFNVESDPEASAFIVQISHREDMMKEKKLCVENFINLKKAEITNLMAGLEKEEDLKAKALEELSELDVKRAQLTRKVDEKNESLKQLQKKKQVLQESIPKKIIKFEEQMEALGSSLKGLKSKLFEYSAKKQKQVKIVETGQNLPLLEYIDKKIEAKEEELECPVCFERASAPIYMCSEEHIVCSTCRPKMSQCPECREIYTEGLRRHRYAEKAAEELEGLYRERAEVLGD